MEAASSHTGDALLPLPAAEPATLSAALVDELYAAAEAQSFGLSREDFAAVLQAVGARLNHNQPPGARADAAQQAAFFRSLRLSELALAQACALGREQAWERFLALYRAPLTQAAIGITGNATLGHDLADSLYSELYGLKERGGERRSPLASYTGRGSLLGWLRTTLAQRHVDHHRRTHRETPLDDLDAPAPAQQPLSPELAPLTLALARTLAALPAEDRFLLSAYFLDRRTLLEISRVLHVHEATISRRLKRLADSLREQLLENLRAGGLSKRAAEEALGVDPRDIEINLRSLLQTSQPQPFPTQAASV